ncbi:MAG: flotillin-like protein FloA [Planctomycetes bacterium]|nr:flotillin-like protein FloA [Planctomycetota bacterium]
MYEVAFIIVALIFILVFTTFALKFGLVYCRALFAGVHVGFFNLVGMWIRRVNPSMVVDSRIIAIKAGLDISYDDLETHYLANGNIINVTRSQVMAAKAQIDLNWEQACAIDLAGRDILEAMRTSTNPKVIDVPKQDVSGATSFISAISKDGIQLKVKARVTVRTNLAQLIGGAVEDTIIARVGEGIVTTIGSSENHKKVLENPDLISKTVLSRGLDNGTAFEIRSIDIADVDVGDNIGAKLQADQAEADKFVAQAKAEERRAMAVAAEQEMRANVEENRAKVVLAEAEVPLAMAEAFKTGRLGVMDYYRMQNIQSDTSMRESISKDKK